MELPKCEKCGKPNPEHEKWKWCQDCRRAFADALSGSSFYTISPDQVESKKGGFLRTKR